MPSKKNHKNNNGYMRQKSIIATIIVIIVVLVALTFLLGRGNLFKFPRKPTFVNLNNSAVPTAVPINGDTIIFTGLRFTPNNLETTTEKVVNFANFGDNNIQLTGLAPTGEGVKLNLGLLKPTDTSDFIKFAAPGVYSYFNKFNPEQKGTITVK